MCWVIYVWNNNILVESWEMSPFKFQWQKVRDEYLRPRFSSMSPQQDSKFWMKNNRNTVIYAISRKRRKKNLECFWLNDWKLDKDFQLALLKWKSRINMKSVRYDGVKIVAYLCFFFVFFLNNGFELLNIHNLACQVRLSIGMDR